MMKKLTLIAMVVGLMACSGIARANYFGTTINSGYVDVSNPYAYLNGSYPTGCNIGGPYYTYMIGSHYLNGNKSTYLEFPVSNPGNGLYPNSTINDAQLCMGIKGGSYYDFSSLERIGVYEIYPNVTSWDGAEYPPVPGFTYWSYNFSYGHNPCGTEFRNGTYCNLTKESNYATVTATNILSRSIVCWNITNLFQRSLNTTGYVRIALTPFELQHYYIYPQFYGCVFEPLFMNGTLDSSEYLPHIKVTCGDTYEDFYDNGQCQTINPATTTTTINSSASYTYDWLNSSTSWVGTAIGSDGVGGKFLIWALLSLGISMVPLIYKWTRDFKMSVVILVAMFLLGVVVGWIPPWVGITFMVIAVALLAKLGTNTFQ